MEHIPPRSFFPRGGGLQLKTIPSCAEHNNAKSNDDQYVLAQICIGASTGEGLARKIFMRSIAPQLSRSPAFREVLAVGSETLSDGSRRYRVDMARLDNFFNHLAAGIFFDRYGRSLNPATHRFGHVYLDLHDDDPEEDQKRRMVAMMLGHLFAGFKDQIAHYEADRIDETVYMNRIMDPAGPDASVTIAHTFYGVFDVATFLTRQVEDA
jgi:hypothetical protein